jgi:hypothetical protein
LIAALGLDPNKRDRAAGVLHAALKGSDSRSLVHRADLALAALELDDLPGSDSRVCFETLIEALSARGNGSRQSDWRIHVFAGATRIEPNALLKVITSDLVSSPEEYDTFANWRDDRIAFNLAADGAARSEVDRAARLLADLHNRGDAPICPIHAFALDALAERQDPGERLKNHTLSARILARSLERSKADAARNNPAHTLNVLAEKILPIPAAELCLRTLEMAKTSKMRGELANVLVKIIARMSPADAAPIADRTGPILVSHLAKEQDATDRDRLAQRWWRA